MFWKIFGLISIVLSWISLFTLLVKWPRVRNRSISQHSASFREAYMFFTAAQVITGLGLYVFMVKWFIPTFRLDWTFTTIYSATTFLQIVSAFVPDTITGKRSALHQALANPFAIGMVILALMLSLAPDIHGIPKLLFVFSTLYMAICVALALFRRGKVEALSNYLTLQVLYIVGFQVAILAATFH